MAESQDAAGSTEVDSGGRRRAEFSTEARRPDLSTETPALHEDSPSRGASRGCVRERLAALAAEEKPGAFRRAEAQASVAADSAAVAEWADFAEVAEGAGPMEAGGAR